jgi:small subunit ribosomal protein SAe
LQVDLFFYRDPEEAKEQEEEVAAAPEFAAITDYQGADQWGGDQWTSDVAAPPVAPTGADWGAAPGIYSYLLLTLKLSHLWY